MMRALAFGLLVGLPIAAPAQSRACADSIVYFEFQVSAQAVWIPDTVAAVHPRAPVRDAANLIQFVVDTLGVPQVRTFRAIKIADSALVFDARRALERWRYSPGLRNGCRVRQLVQTTIER
jgi:hypothetical protein